MNTLTAFLIESSRILGRGKSMGVSRRRLAHTHTHTHTHTAARRGS